MLWGGILEGNNIDPQITQITQIKKNKQLPFNTKAQSKIKDEDR